MRLVGICFIEF